MIPYLANIRIVDIEMQEVEGTPHFHDVRVVHLRGGQVPLRVHHVVRYGHGAAVTETLVDRVPHACIQTTNDLHTFQ